MKNGRYVENGNLWWYKNGEPHREDGPAFEHANGSQGWYLNGERHRLDGPAITWLDEHEQWWVYGKLHRENGPAYEDTNGLKQWFREGKLIAIKVMQPHVLNWSQKKSSRNSLNLTCCA